MLLPSQLQSKLGPLPKELRVISSQSILKNPQQLAETPSWSPLSSITSAALWFDHAGHRSRLPLTIT